MKLSKKTAAVIFSLCFILLAGVSIYFITDMIHENDSEKNKGISVSNTVRGVARDDGYIPMYIVRDVEGRVSVCDYNTGKVVITSDIWTFTLPMTERERLRSGIIVIDSGDLNTLMDGYNS